MTPKTIKIENPNVLDKRRLKYNYNFLVEYKGETDILYEWEGMIFSKKPVEKVTIYIKKDTVLMYDPNNFSSYNAVRIIFWDAINQQRQAVIHNLRIEEVRQSEKLLQVVWIGMNAVLNQP